MCCIRADHFYEVKLVQESLREARNTGFVSIIFHHFKQSGFAGLQEGVYFRVFFSQPPKFHCSAFSERHENFRFNRGCHQTVQFNEFSFLSLELLLV